ncbi:hypothetical protein ACIGW4_37960, partial [Streptomyces sp. NPDC053513]|uniref:hypothetical protein n=1 Tax=unclassified Streptomyces TaxID=2593676 RepID=UPI0037D82A39
MLPDRSRPCSRTATANGHVLNLNSCCRSAVHDQAGADQAAVNHVRAVLDLLEPMLDGAGDLTEVGCGEVANVTLDQRPDAFL